MNNLLKIRQLDESGPAWDLILRMNEGEFGAADLAAIGFYAKKMAQVMERREADQFKVGGRAQVTSKAVSPKYLQGATGEIIEVEPRTGSVTIALDEAIRNRPAGAWITYPNSCFTALSA